MFLDLLALVREEVSAEQRTALAVYGEALGQLRKGEPERAAEVLSNIAGDDSVAAALKGRAEEQALSGEPYEQGVLVLRQK